MANVLLFHHALGLTPGMDAFADVLRDAGHTVTVPDFYEGQTFSTLEAGMAHAEIVGFDVVESLGVGLAERLPSDVVYIGFSLGVMPAQRLAQTRPGALGAVLVSACLPLGVYADSWPQTVPLQIHGMEDDPVFVAEGDLDAARNLVEAAAEGELVLYPGDGHFFADIGSPEYDADAAHSLTSRVLDLLARPDPAGGTG